MPETDFRRTPFVGRRRELAILEQGLDAAARGEGGTIIIAGEPGIGKTRLLAEFSRLAQTKGWLVLAGHCYDTGANAPYLPFTEALRDPIHSLSKEDLSPERLEVAVQIALIVPELGKRLDLAPNSGSLGPEGDRLRLFEAVVGFFLSLARSTEASGVLFCVDDLHWADRATLLLLEHLCRRLENARLLVTATYRSEGVALEGPIADFLADLTRERLDRRLLLPPFGKDDTEALITGLRNTLVAPEVVRAIQEWTEGNPFFIEEVTQQFSAAGQDLADPSVIASARHVPEAVQEVVSQRLARLNPETMQLLRAAAVLGAEFEEDLVGELCGLDRPSAVNAFEEAARAGMIGEEGVHYRFRHALIRQVVYDGLSLARRHDLHLRAAEAIEAKRAPSADAYATVLASHYQLAATAADPDKALPHLLEAGSRALSMFAYDEAVSHWEAAIETMERAARPPSERAGLLIKLGDLMYTTGFINYPRSRDFLRRALTLYERAGDIAGAVNAHRLLARVYSSSADTQDLGQALTHLRAIEPHYAAAPVSSELASFYTGLASTAGWQLRTEEALRYAERALEINRELGPEVSNGTQNIAYASNLMHLGRLEESAVYFHQARQVADRADQTFAGFMAAAWGGCRLGFWMADPAVAKEFLESEIAKPRQEGAPARRRALQGDLACAYVLAGDLEGASLLLRDVGDEVFDQEAACYGQPPP